MRVSRFLTTTIGAALAAVVLACGGGGDAGTGPTPTPTIALTAAPATLHVAAGQSGSVQINLARGGSYAGAVTLAASGAPNGVIVTPTPATLSGTTASSAVAITVASTAAVGTYPITITGTGAGVASDAETFALTVTAAAPQTQVLTVARAGTGAGTVTSTPNGIDCGTTCSAAFTSGANVTLTAAASTGSTFGGWSGACTGTSATCVVAMSQAQNVTATFSQNAVTFPLTVTTAGTGTGTVTSAPAGITCPTTCASNFTSGTLVTLTAAPSTDSFFGGWNGACAGTTPTCTVTVDQARTTNASFTRVTAQSFALAVAPTALTVQQGATATSQLTITRTNNFVGAVALGTTGAPNGLTVTANPVSVTGTTAAISVAAASTTAAGTYTITINGTSTGVAAQSTTLSVQVTQAPVGGTGNIAMRFAGCDAIDTPIWLAAQDGTGAWNRITADANGTYRFSIGTRGGVASVTRGATNYSLEVFYGSVAELSAIAAGNPCAAAPTGTKRLTGNVANAGAMDFITISLGAATTTVFGNTPPAFALDDVAAGPLDLLASRAALSETGLAVDKLIIRRGVNYATTVPTIDFTSGEAFDPIKRTITLAGLNGEEGFASVSYVTANGSGAPFFSGQAEGSTIDYFGIPASKQAAGDLHQLLVGAFASGANPTASRMSYGFFRDATDRTVTLGAALSPATVTSVATAPYARLRAQFASQADYNALATATFAQAARQATVSASAAYFGGTPATWDLAIPDLANVAGFDATWGLRTATQANWSVTALGGDFLTLSGQAPTDGALVKAASRSGNAAALRAYLGKRGVTLNAR